MLEAGRLCMSETDKSMGLVKCKHWDFINPPLELQATKLDLQPIGPTPNRQLTLRSVIGTPFVVRYSESARVFPLSVPMEALKTACRTMPNNNVIIEFVSARNRLHELRRT